MSALFSKKLRRLREEKGWTQEDLARECNLTAKAIYNYERGDELHVPRKENLNALARALDTTVAKLCPSYPFVSLMDILHERIAEEIESIDAYISKATPRDLERLECILKAYDLSTGLRKLDLDLMIHREITSYAETRGPRRINTLTLQFFSQIDEFIADSDLLDPQREEELGEVHVKLAEAALLRNKGRMEEAYSMHLAQSRDFIVRTFAPCLRR